MIGVNQDRRFDFPMARAFAMGLTFRIGTCSVQETWPELIPLLQSGFTCFCPLETILRKLGVKSAAQPA